MDDRDFFDLLFQQWSKTTGAENQFWMPTKHEGKSVFHIDAVNQNQEKRRVASYVSEADADWITAVHGCFGDLVRRMHQALDESDRLDCYVDEQENRIAGLEMESDKLFSENRGLERDCEVLTAQLIERDGELHECHVTISDLHSQIGYLEVYVRDLEYQLHEVGL